MSAFAMPASAAVAAIVASFNGRRPDSPRSMTGKGGSARRWSRRGSGMRGAARRDPRAPRAVADELPDVGRREG